MLFFQNYSNLYPPNKTLSAQEMHNFLFEKANERLAHGKRIDFTSDDIEYKQKKRLKNVRIGLFLFTVFWAFILVTMLSLILVFKEYSIVSGLGLFTIAFTSIWGQYYNEQRSAKIMKMSVLDTNYDYENHMLLLLQKLEKSDKVKRIIFVFHGLDQLISSELYDVLNSIRVFLNKKNIKYIILIDERKLLSSVGDAIENNKISSDNSASYISEYFNYTLRLRPLTSLQLNIAFDEYYEKIADFVSEKWQTVLGRSKNILVSNETKKRVIKDFILWKNDLSFREIVKGLNIFIANFRTRRNSLTYYEQLIRILIISCIEYNFSDIFIELVKDRDSFIRTKILQLVKNKSEYAILKLIDDIEKNASSNDTNWIIESYNVSSDIKSSSKTEIKTENKIENKIEDNTANSANVKKTATRIETITEVMAQAKNKIEEDNDKQKKLIINQFKLSQIKIGVFNNVQFIKFLFHIKKYLVIIKKAYFHCQNEDSKTLGFIKDVINYKEPNCSVTPLELLTKIKTYCQTNKIIYLKESFSERLITNWMGKILSDYSINDSIISANDLEFILKNLGLNFLSQEHKVRLIDWAIFFAKNDNYDEYRKVLILTMEKLQTLNDSSNLIIEKDEKEKISELFVLINNDPKKYHNLKRFRNFLETLVTTTIKKHLDTDKGVENNLLEFSKNPCLSTTSIDSGIYTVPTSPVEFTNSETEEQQQNKFIFSTGSKTDTNNNTKL
ncbi:P-loop NTPase fold protein [Spiroplasma endosymbiont of Dilophus febrilis]|uniref:P-loop NTPase fold protein n=1 Tax=Spiroplasma endosymbiont of Dilophus febrilis TaxID=3066292 RepID=UPI00313F0CA2